jgi:hypothetical protein
MEWYTRLANIDLPEKPIDDPEGFMEMSPEDREREIEESRRRRLERMRAQAPGAQQPPMQKKPQTVPPMGVRTRPQAAPPVPRRR